MSAKLSRRQLRILPQQQRADAPRTAEFVSADGETGRLQPVKVDADFPNRLHGIDVQRDAIFAA